MAAFALLKPGKDNLQQAQLHWIPDAKGLSVSILWLFFFLLLTTNHSDMITKLVLEVGKYGNHGDERCNEKQVYRLETA